MKTTIKTILALTTMAIAVNSASAQSSTASNTLSGVNSSNPTQYLGSNNTYDLIFKTANVEKMRILSTGNVGIGTINPVYKLSVLGGIGWGNTSISSVLSSDQGGSIELGGTNSILNPVANGVPYLDFHYNTGAVQDYNMRIINSGNNRLEFNQSGGALVLTLDNGKVLIGNTTTPGSYKLYVETGILTEKVKVALKSSVDWADYVFTSSYKLKPLSEVEAFIKMNKHLEGVPSADELVKDGGIDLGSMQAKQMAKIEELTLYIIELNKKVLEQNNRILVLEAEKQ